MVMLVHQFECMILENNTEIFFNFEASISTENTQKIETLKTNKLQLH